MTKCVSAVDAHTRFISLLIRLEGMEARALMGVWKKRTWSQTWIQNHMALVNSLAVIRLCFIDYRVLRFRPTRLHRSRKIGVVFAGVSRSRATRKLNYEHNDLGINNTNKKETSMKKEM